MEILGVLVVILAGICAVVYKKFYKPLEDKDVSSLFEPIEPMNPIIEKPMEPKTDNGAYLYLKSKSFLGQDLTPADEIPDYVACVSQLQEVYRRTFGKHIGFAAALYSTKALKDHLLKDPDFLQVNWDEARAGDICVFATGEGNVGARGHCFVVGKVDWMSNNSNTGRWSADYNKQGVHNYYTVKLGLKPYVFRLK